MYRQVLAVIDAAAQEAGRLLRQEFHRVGGPLGVGEHAEAGIEAERLIQTRLRAAARLWGYLDEERGEWRQGARHYWIVNPSEDSRGFLSGCRGSAVSIGLLREGLHVLGVVYAYNAPDDAGDLFS